jgi:hypothetical protein
MLYLLSVCPQAEFRPGGKNGNKLIRTKVHNAAPF